MKSTEALIGEAVASLTARLHAVGVDTAGQLAHEFVQDMLRAGWRPGAAPAVETPRSGPRCQDSAPYIAAARKAIEDARRARQEASS